MDDAGEASKPLNEILARSIQDVMRRKNWSFAQAERETGVPASTLNRMTQGMNVKPDTVKKFAIAIKGDLDRWRKIADGVDPDAQADGSANAFSEPLPVLIEAGTLLEFVLPKQPPQTIVATNELITIWLAVAKLGKPKENEME